MCLRYTLLYTLLGELTCMPLTLIATDARLAPAGPSFGTEDSMEPTRRKPLLWSLGDTGKVPAAMSSANRSTGDRKAANDTAQDAQAVQAELSGAPSNIRTKPWHLVLTDQGVFTQCRLLQQISPRTASVLIAGAEQTVSCRRLWLWIPNMHTAGRSRDVPTAIMAEYNAAVAHHHVADSVSRHLINPAAVVWHGYNGGPTRGE